MVVSTGATILADSMATIMCTYRLILGNNVQMEKTRVIYALISNIHYDLTKTKYGRWNHLSNNLKKKKQ